MATYKKWTSTVLVNGQPEPNVKVYVYEPGTTNEIPIYEDEGVTQITQPILTDSQGRYAFFVDVDAYPEIRLYLEKDGVDFSEVNEDLDGIPVPGAVGEVSMGFTDLTDTPSDYSGSGGQVVKVKTAEDGLEFGQVDHGELSGLSDDDHPQYLLADGSRPLSGDLDFQGHLAKVIGKLNFKDATILTISSGAITVSQSYHYVDTEGEAASDNLDTINGGAAGDILYLRSADSSRTVVIKHGTGNIVTPDGTDYSLDSTDKVVALLFDGTNWHLVGAAGGGGSGASTFLDLTDTPSDYSGNAGKVVRVNAEENGLEFGTVSGGAGTFTELTDTPSSYVGRGGDVVVVKTTEDGIETQPWPVTGTVLNVFLSSDAADIGDYYYMYHTETGDTHSEFTSPSLSTGNDQLLWSFVTEAGQPGLNQLALGAYTATLFLKKSGNKDVRVYWKLFKRDTSGNETEILESAVSDYLTTDNSQYLISAYLNEDQVLDPTDRLVLKLFANVSGTGTDVTVTLTMEGDYDSRLTINVLSSAFNLDRLSDVTISSPSNDEVLAYDSGSGKWINQAATDPNAIHDDVAGEISGITEKATLDDADLLLIEDSAAAYAKKKALFSSMHPQLPGCLVYQASGNDQSVPYRTDTKIDFTTADFDPDNLFDLTNDKFTAPRGGRYLVVFKVQLWEIGDTGAYVSAKIYKNGSQYSEGAFYSSGGDPGPNLCALNVTGLELAENDYLEFYARTDETGGSSTFAGKERVWVYIQMLQP